jgi:hypothetical protein
VAKDIGDFPIGLMRFSEMTVTTCGNVILEVEIYTF